MAVRTLAEASTSRSSLAGDTPVLVHNALREAGGEDLIATSRAGYVVHVGPGQLDVLLFESQVEEARRSSAAGTADAAIENSRKADDRESERRSLGLRARICLKAGDIDAALLDCESVLLLTGTSDDATDLDDLIAALESVGKHDYAGRIRRRTAGVGSA